MFWQNDGSRVNRLWLGWPFSFRILWALCGLASPVTLKLRKWMPGYLLLTPVRTAWGNQINEILGFKTKTSRLFECFIELMSSVHQCDCLLSLHRPIVIKNIKHHDCSVSHGHQAQLKICWWFFYIWRTISNATHLHSSFSLIFCFWLTQCHFCRQLDLFYLGISVA